MMDEDFAESLGQAFDQLRLTRELTDITLVSNEHKFAAHRTILAASSPYFLHLFTNQTVGSPGDIMNVSGIETEALRTLLDYIYTGRLLLPSDMDKLSDLLRASHQLQVTDFHRDAESVLVESITSDNYPSLWTVAERHGAAQLADRVEAYVAARLEKLSQRRPFTHLKPEWLRRVLARASLAEGVQPETCARAMLAWCKGSVGDRRTELASMLPHVRLKLAPVAFLHELWSSEAMIQDVPCLREEVKALIKEAEIRLGGGGKTTTTTGGAAGSKGSSDSDNQQGTVSKQTLKDSGEKMNTSREKLFTRRSNVPRPVSPARSVSSQLTGSPVPSSQRGLERPSSASPAMAQRRTPSLSNTSSPIPSGSVRVDRDKGRDVDKQTRPSSCTESRPSKIPRATGRQPVPGTVSSSPRSSSNRRSFHQRSRSLSSSTIVMVTPPSHDRSPIAEESAGTVSPQRNGDSDSNRTYSVKDSISDDDEDMRQADASISTTTRLLKESSRTNSVGNLRVTKASPHNPKMSVSGSCCDPIALSSVSMQVFGTDVTDEGSVSDGDLDGISISMERGISEVRSMQASSNAVGVLNEVTGLPGVSPLSFGIPDGSPVSSELGAAENSCHATSTATSGGANASCSSSNNNNNNTVTQPQSGTPTKKGNAWSRSPLPRRPTSAGSHGGGKSDPGSRISTSGSGSSWAETVLLIVGKKKSGTISIRCLNPAKGLWLPVCHVDLGPKSPVAASSLLGEGAVAGDDGGNVGRKTSSCKSAHSNPCPVLEGAGSTSVGSTLYLIGGLQEDENGLTRFPSTSVVAVDARPQPRVRRLPSMTKPRAAPGAAVLAGRLYVIGGRSDQGKATNHVERYDVKNMGQWTPVASLPVPSWEIGVATSGGLIFAMGGRWRHEWSHASYAYDPALDQWTRVDALPAIFRDTYPVLASHGEYVYAVRHLNPKGDGYVCYYDPPNSIWSIPRSSGPGAKKVLAMLPFKEKFWVVDYSGRLYSYDPTNHRWEPACTFNKFVPCPLYAAMLRMSHE